MNLISSLLKVLNSVGMLLIDYITSDKNYLNEINKWLDSIDIKENLI